MLLGDWGRGAISGANSGANLMGAPIFYDTARCNISTYQNPYTCTASSWHAVMLNSPSHACKLEQVDKRSSDDDENPSLTVEHSASAVSNQSESLD